MYNDYAQDINMKNLLLQDPTSNQQQMWVYGTVTPKLSYGLSEPLSSLWWWAVTSVLDPDLLNLDLYPGFWWQELLKKFNFFSS